MNKSEVKLLLADVAAIDNRRVTDETVDAWKAVLGHLPLKVAQQALVMARQDEKIDYLEPKHIVARARDARMAIERSPNSRAEEAQWRSEPEPVCVPHSERITRCEPCIALLVKQTQHMTNDQRHRWSNEHIGFKN